MSETLAISTKSVTTLSGHSSSSFSPDFSTALFAKGRRAASKSAGVGSTGKFTMSNTQCGSSSGGTSLGQYCPARPPISSVRSTRPAESDRVVPGIQPMPPPETPSNVRSNVNSARVAGSQASVRGGVNSPAYRQPVDTRSRSAAPWKNGQSGFDFASARALCHVDPR